MGAVTGQSTKKVARPSSGKSSATQLCSPLSISTHLAVSVGLEGVRDGSECEGEEPTLQFPLHGISSEADISLAFDAPSLLEKAIDFDKEIAIIVSRNESGEIKLFPTVEMAFHPTQNLVEYLFSPANISEKINGKAEKIARDIAEKLGIVGLLAVEMFGTKTGEILVNEVAPRTHNSGHHTIRANFTSQFEQQLRAVLNLPLGDTSAFLPSAMVNLLGEEGYEGQAKYVGMSEVLAVKGVFPFLYGKKITKPFRKMGHVTVLGNNIEELEEKVNLVREKLKVVSF